jgi:long-chain acyl-CoA synthetase
MTRQPRSLVQMVEHSVRAFAGRPVFGERVAGAWSWMTYREVGIHIDELRSGLAGLGVGAGDRVAIISRNSAAWAAAAYATYGLGATFVPMYEAQRQDDWEFILRDCNATLVFVRTAEIAATVERMRGALPAIRNVITIEAPVADPRSYDALRRLGRDQVVPVLDPDPESIAGFIYTSGTTGQPKGVMLSHANLASNVAASTSVFPVAAGDRSLSFLPWAHVYGQTIELHILFSVGASTAFNHDVSKLVDDLREVRPTLLVAVPRIFNKIHDGVRAQIARKPRPVQAVFRRGIAASIRKRRGERLAIGARFMLWLANLLVFRKIRDKFGGRLKYAISASATLSHEVAELIDALGLDVYEGYGLSETSPVVTANRPGERKLGSVGRPIPGVTVRIDESVGDALGAGEVVVYGPNVMKGYHARPDENARAFSEDGGLRTGDLGRIDADGYLYITGRIKEQYKLQTGRYVVPTPLEEQLALSPYITTVMLHGADRPYNVALVVIDPVRVRAWAAEYGHAVVDLTTDPAVHELIAHELQTQGARFRGYERPLAFVITDEELTTASGLLTPTLKLKRQAVLARFGPALDALYERRPIAPPPAEPSAAPPSAEAPRPYTTG